MKLLSFRRENTRCSEWLRQLYVSDVNVHVELANCFPVCVAKYTPRMQRTALWSPSCLSLCTASSADTAPWLRTRTAIVRIDLGAEFVIVCFRQKNSAPLIDVRKQSVIQMRVAECKHGVRDGLTRPPIRQLDVAKTYPALLQFTAPQEGRQERYLSRNVRLFVRRRGISTAIRKQKKTTLPDKPLLKRAKVRLARLQTSASTERPLRLKQPLARFPIKRSSLEGSTAFEPPDPTRRTTKFLKHGSLKLEPSIFSSKMQRTNRVGEMDAEQHSRTEFARPPLEGYLTRVRFLKRRMI